MRDQFWQTVWAETITSYTGRRAIWDRTASTAASSGSSEDQARIQSGPMEGPPDELWVGNRGWLYAAQSDDGSDQLPEGVATGSLKRPMLSQLGLMFEPLQPWEMSGSIRTPGKSVPPGATSIAGREAVVVELLDHSGARSARLWLDTQTSFVLRHQQFRPSGDAQPGNRDHHHPHSVRPGLSKPGLVRS